MSLSGVAVSLNLPRPSVPIRYRSVLSFPPAMYAIESPVGDARRLTATCVAACGGGQQFAQGLARAGRLEETLVVGSGWNLGLFSGEVAATWRRGRRLSAAGFSCEPPHQQNGGGNDDRDEPDPGSDRAKDREWRPGPSPALDRRLDRLAVRPGCGRLVLGVDQRPPPRVQDLCTRRGSGRHTHPGRRAPSSRTPPTSSGRAHARTREEEFATRVLPPPSRGS